MPDAGVLIKVRNKILRTTGHMYYRRPLQFAIAEPIISFTFDDFPRSALYEGGAILNKYGARGTYFASAGLMGKHEPSGEMFVADDLRTLIEEGHELGCHTFAHFDAMLTRPSAFEASILENRRALEMLCASPIRTFSYPKAEPNPGTKRAAGRHSLCCRAGGQTFNRQHADLNCLKSFFLEQARHDPESIKRLINENFAAPGWLIFATHDIAEQPTPYGSTPAFFEEIVAYAAQSGARLLTLGAACDALLDARRVSARIG
jgi:peptidoglycan/xylan/chitin deacetylase (PgdA/CDA1 family)